MIWTSKHSQNREVHLSENYCNCSNLLIILRPLVKNIELPSASEHFPSNSAFDEDLGSPIIKLFLLGFDLFHFGLAKERALFLLVNFVGNTENLYEDDDAEYCVQTEN